MWQALSEGSKCCVCHTDSRRGPRRPGANPFWTLQVLRLPHREEPRPTSRRTATLSRGSKSATPTQAAAYNQTRHAATLSGGSKYCACHIDRSRGPRRPGAPQPFLGALSTAPATRTEAAALSRGSEMMR